MVRGLTAYFSGGSQGLGQGRIVHDQAGNHEEGAWNGLFPEEIGHGIGVLELSFHILDHEEGGPPAVRPRSRSSNGQTCRPGNPVLDETFNPQAISGRCGLG
jgi:hypothetical protein